MNIDAAVSSDLLLRRETQFTLWCPSIGVRPPGLVIETLRVWQSQHSRQPQRYPALRSESGGPQVYGLLPSGRAGSPTAFTTTGSKLRIQIQPSLLPRPFSVLIRSPPPSIGACSRPLCLLVSITIPIASLPPLFTCGMDGFQPSTRGGETASFPDDPRPDTLPANNHLVIYPNCYCLDTRSRYRHNERGVGTFKDILALVDETASGANFEGLDVLNLRDAPT